PLTATARAENRQRSRRADRRLHCTPVSTERDSSPLPAGPAPARPGPASPAGPQTAETCSSSATRKEDPQPHAATTLGLLTLKPAPCRLSSKSISEPRTKGRLSLSTSSFKPWLSNTTSPSRCSSKASWY